MSWITEISDAIVDRRSPDAIHDLIQAAISDQDTKIQTLIDATSPDDYPMLLLSLKITVAQLESALPSEALRLVSVLQPLCRGFLIVKNIERRPS